jgi:hypothetical protein
MNGAKPELDQNLHHHLGMIILPHHFIPDYMPFAKQHS